MNDENTKNIKKINKDNINRKKSKLDIIMNDNKDKINRNKSKLDIIRNDNKDNNNWQIINKRFNFLMIMGGVVLPLCYLINFLNSNLK